MIYNTQIEPLADRYSTIVEHNVFCSFRAMSNARSYENENPDISPPGTMIGTSSEGVHKTVHEFSRERR